MKRDRFELLSAYLDGEVTPEERQLVNRWLAHDPTAKNLYNRLLCIRQGMQACPIERASTFEETLTGVFHCLNRRIKMTCMAGAGALTMGILGTLSGVFNPLQGSVQWAFLPTGGDADQEILQVALDQPAFPIPKAPTASNTSVLQTEVLGIEASVIETEL